MDRGSRERLYECKHRYKYKCEYILKLSLKWNLVQYPINSYFEDEERDLEHLSQVPKTPVGHLQGQQADRYRPSLPQISS